MAAVVGVWLALSGVVPVLVGLTALRRVRRLRGHGMQAWAAAVPEPSPDGERRTALQFTLPDGRVIERPTAGQTAALLPGERVLIWYDPADPQDILIQGDNGRTSDLVFVITGIALVAAGIVIGIVAP